MLKPNLTSEEPTVKNDPTFFKLAKLILKIGITVLCFWWISKKIDFNEAKTALVKANWWWLFAAVTLYALSKLFSAFRLNIYFKNISIQLPEWTNIKLYWLGMFYNLFLPGSISGDAYKVILLKKRFDSSYKRISAAVLLDRFSGLVALGLILAVYGIITLSNRLYYAGFIAGSVVATLILYFIIRRYFSYFYSGFWSTFFWGLAVQLTQVICIYCILMALHLPLIAEWIFIFLAAAIFAVFPISLGGGLGTRELVFVFGANFFHLDPDIAPVISILFFLATLIASMPGLYFVFHDPLATKKAT